MADNFATLISFATLCALLVVATAPSEGAEYGTVTCRLIISPGGSVDSDSMMKISRECMGKFPKAPPSDPKPPRRRTFSNSSLEEIAESEGDGV